LPYSEDNLSRRKLSLHCTTLQKLYIKGGAGILDSGMVALLDRNSHMENLQLIRCEGFTSNGMGLLARSQNALQYLKELTLDRLTG
jgi:hypothetical protein